MVANHVDFYSALLSHFPDERASVPGPQPWPSRSGWGFHLAEGYSRSLDGSAAPTRPPEPLVVAQRGQRLHSHQRQRSRSQPLP
jgi:hypothetical protein